jgi:hypothetical protein
MSRRVKCRENVYACEIAGLTVLVPLVRGIGDLDGAFMLDEVGGAIWSMIDKGCSLDEMVSLLIDEFDVDDETARRDVRQIVEELESEGLAEGSC